MKKVLSLFSIIFLASWLFADTKVVEFKYSDGQTIEDFYSQNYKAQWKKLPEVEQYAIAFSSNLFQANYLYHYDFSAKTKLNDYASDPKDLLSESWGITDYKSLIEMFNSLEEYGHSGAYKKLSDLLDKYPDKNVFEIAILEHLEVLDITRLMYVRDTRANIGPHGIEAWDRGREITILRWGIACGYISKDEALELMIPVIEKLKKDYSSWSDFSAHYWMGRGFYYLYNYTQSEMRGDAIYQDYMARAYLPLDSIKFYGKDDPDQPYALTTDESQDLIDWKEVQLLYNNNEKNSKIENLLEIEKKYPEYPQLFFWWHVQCLRSESDYDMIEYIEANRDYLNTYDKDSEVFYYATYFYILALNYTYQPQKVLNVFASLPSDFSITLYYYYQYGLANYHMLNFCSTQLLYDTYKQRALEVFVLLRDQYNFELDDMIARWVELSE